MAWLGGKTRLKQTLIHTFAFRVGKDWHTRGGFGGKGGKVVYLMTQSQWSNLVKGIQILRKLVGTAPKGILRGDDGTEHLFSLGN